LTDTEKQTIRVEQFTRKQGGVDKRTESKGKNAADEPRGLEENVSLAPKVRLLFSISPTKE